MKNNKNYVWSLDISTTNIGSALWDEKGKLIELKHLELKTPKDVPKESRDIYKADIFKNYVLNYKEKIEETGGKIVETVVEDPLGGSNNQNTVNMLFGFNGMARYILYDIFKTIPIKISVRESRIQYCPELVTRKKVKGQMKDVLSFPKEYRKEKKLYIWQKVSKQYPDINWFYKNNGKVHDKSFDMSDATVVGYAYFKINKIL